MSGGIFGFGGSSEQEAKGAAAASTARTRDQSFGVQGTDPGISSMLQNFISVIDQQKRDANVLAKWQNGIKQNTSEADIAAALERQRREAAARRDMRNAQNPHALGSQFMPARSQARPVDLSHSIRGLSL